MLCSNIAQHIELHKQLGSHPWFSTQVWLALVPQTGPGTQDWLWHPGLALAPWTGPGTPDWPWHPQTGPGTPRLALALQTGPGTSRLALALAPQTARKLFDSAGPASRRHSANLK